MQSTIKFPSEAEFELHHYPIYKDLKNVENVVFHRTYKYVMVLTSPSFIYIYDNYTKLNLGKVDFVEALRKSPLYVQYEPALKAYAESKEKQKLIDSLSFSKSEDFVALASARLGSVFLVKTNLTSLLKEPGSEPQVIGFIKLKYSPGKDLCLKLVTDPFSKYNCMVSGQGAFLTNIKLPVEFKLPQKSENMEVEKEDDNKNAVGGYLDIHCTKTRKTLALCDQESVGVYSVDFNKEKTEYSNLSLLMTFKSASVPRISQIQVNSKCNMLVVQYYKKLARVFWIDWENKQLGQKAEFEANEGRSWYDVIFNTYKNNNEEMEDWVLLLEKNTLSTGISWYNIESKYQKHQIIDFNPKIRRIHSNLLWKSSLMGVSETGTILNIELKIPTSWVRYSYRFSYTNANLEYIEKETEFDREEEVDPLKLAHLEKNSFDLLPENSIGYLLGQHKNMFTPKFLPAERLPERKLVTKKEEEKRDDEAESETEEEHENRGVKQETPGGHGIKEEHLERGWLKQENGEDSSEEEEGEEEGEGEGEGRERMMTEDIIAAKLEEHEAKTDQQHDNDNEEGPEGVE